MRYSPVMIILLSLILLFKVNIVQAAPDIIINEFSRAEQFANSEYIEFLLTRDMNSGQLEALYWGDSRTATNSKCGIYQFQNLSGIASLFKAGTIICIGGATTAIPSQDTDYDPALPANNHEAWNLRLQVGETYVDKTSPSCNGDFAETDVVWIDTSDSGTSSIDSINWDSSPGTFGALAKVSIANPDAPGNVEFTGDGGNHNQTGEYAVNSTGSLGDPNGGANSVWISNLRSPPSPPCTDILLTNTSIPENQPVGTFIGTLSAVDPASASHTFYRVVRWDGPLDRTAFYLDRDEAPGRSPEGDTLRSARIFDYETKNSYAVYIRCNSGGGSCFKTFAISVSDVNEPPTNFVLSYRWVDEEKPAGTRVGDFTTFGDPDKDDSHVYALVSGDGDTDNSIFGIEGKTLKTKVSFDFETAEKHQFDIRVRTTDEGGLSYEKSFVITINDGNEPPFDITLSNSSVDENRRHTLVGSFSSTDPNPGDSHLYSLVPGEGDTDNDLFRITSDTLGPSFHIGNILRAKPGFDYETRDSYSILVRTDDGKGGAFTKNFIITVNDVNEPPGISPIPDQHTEDDFPVGPLSFTINDPETPADQLILSAESSDPALLPDENIGIDCSGTECSLVLIPSPEISGTASVTLTVSDGELTAGTSFSLSIAAPDPISDEAEIQETETMPDSGDDINDEILEPEPDEILEPEPIDAEISVNDCPGGDANLKNVIRILQLLAGMETENFYLCKDISGDGKIGFEEVIYLLKKLSHDQG